MNVLEVLLFATEVVDDTVASAPEAMDGDAENARLTTAYALKGAHDKAENAEVKLAKTTKVQKKMQKPTRRTLKSARRAC